MKRLAFYAEELIVMGFLALYATSGCTSDRAFVADSAAARMYYEDRYERKCVQTKGPVTCATAQTALNLLEHHDATGKPVGLIPVANAVQQIGKLPKDAKKEISDTLKLVRVD